MNIAEILKYCPKYTKLYSPTWGNVKLIEVTSTKVIKIKVCNYTEELTSEGCYSVKGECILFPSKNQRDWNKFRLPVKRGDIMMDANGECPFIATGEFYKDISPKYICGINSLGNFQLDYAEAGWTSIFYIPASEEAKKKLFDKMAEAGYKWNANTLKLEKIESKFKEGDVIIDNQGSLCLVSKIRDDSSVIIAATLYANKALNVFISNNVNRYIQLVTIASTTDRNKLYSALTRKGYKYDKEQHKLVKQEFKPFEKVLVRDDTNKKWLIDLFSYYDEENENFPYVCMHIHYRYCIPYEGNEYLLGTTNDIKN